MKFSGIFFYATLVLASVATAAPDAIPVSCTTARWAALTFDISTGNRTNDLLNQLDISGTKATFFVRDLTASRLALLKTISESGHELAIQVQTTGINPSQRTSDLLQGVLSAFRLRPRLARISSGSCNEACQATVQELGLIPTGSNLDQNAFLDINNIDSYFTETNSLIIRQPQGPNWAQQLKTTVSAAQKHGYAFVTLAECVGEAPYDSGNPAVTPTTATVTFTTTTTMTTTEPPVATITSTVNATPTTIEVVTTTETTTVYIPVTTVTLNATVSTTVLNATTSTTLTMNQTTTVLSPTPPPPTTVSTTDLPSTEATTTVSGAAVQVTVSVNEAGATVHAAAWTMLLAVIIAFAMA
ncbi:chitin deacetylase [Gamsiella multidivaricata]|nr:chitin deacetylase [Gamsiella multidivaricata]